MCSTILSCPREPLASLTVDTDPAFPSLCRLAHLSQMVLYSDYSGGAMENLCYVLRFPWALVYRSARCLAGFYSIIQITHLKLG